MVVAVDTNLHDTPGREGVLRAELVAQAGAVGDDALCALAERRREIREPGGERVGGAGELRLHRLLPAGHVSRRDRFGRQGVAGRGGGERPVQATRERAEPRGLVRVRRCQGTGEDGVRRFLPAALDRGGVVLGEPLESGRPRVAVVRHELVQHGQRDRLRAVGLVGDRTGESGGARERRLAREEVRELELGTRPGFEPPEELQDRPAVVDDRGVALLAPDRPRLARRRRQDLVQRGRRHAPERTACAREGRATPDRLQQGQTERRLGHRVDERLLAGARRRDGHAVALPPLVSEDHVEQGEEPRRSRHRRVVDGDDRGYLPVLAAEPSLAAQGLPQRDSRARRERLGGRRLGIPDGHRAALRRGA